MSGASAPPPSAPAGRPRQDAATWAAFHGTPAEVLAALAREPGHGGEPAWLRGVALTAAGRYGEALAVLLPLVTPHEPADTTDTTDTTDGPTPRAVPTEVRVQGAATLSSLLRQVGAHDAGAAADALGLELAAGPDGGSAARSEAAADCALGLVADDVGRGRRASALARLDQAELRVAALPSSAWRCRVRLAWVQAEAALLAGHPAAALAVLPTALARARQAAAPRHVAKTLLFLGVAQQVAGDDAAAGTLAAAATSAQAHGLPPLVWPAWLVLGRLLAGGPDPLVAAGGRRRVERAAELSRGLAAGLPAASVEACAARLHAALRESRGY